MTKQSDVTNDLDNLALVYRRDYHNIDNRGVVTVEYGKDDPSDGKGSTHFYYPIALEMLDKLEREGVLIPMKHPSKAHVKLEQQLNRIRNTMIGRSRIWELDRLAVELEIDAQVLSDEWTLGGEIGEGEITRLAHLKRYTELLADALYLRRLEWDLQNLRMAINGGPTRVGGKYDEDNWRGSRP